MPLELYNTLTRQKELFRPRDPARVTFYSCGPTVYDDAHIGNFRSFLAADVLRRWVESPLCELVNDPASARRAEVPRRVVHVMNITDVGHMTDDAEGGEAGEDRMAVAGRRLLEQKKQGKVGSDIDPSDPYQIARYFEGRFKEDARKLGLKLVVEAEKDASLMPRATENVEGMKRLIARLIEKGNAYVVGALGSRVVYFRVKSFAPYGRLSGNTLDKLREGEGGRVSAGNQASKEHPADFLLWKEDPSHIMKWESPWGAGYPGWHIECSVMSLRARHEGTEARRHEADTELASLVVPNGEPLIDLHSGGEDNIFPHHECEIAQSCSAFNGEPEKGTYSGMWFHPRFLLVEGAKMSKSKGNFFTARDLFARGVEPAALRLELIKTHHRSNANFTMQGLTDSQRLVDRWRRVHGAGGAGNGNEAARKECADAFSAAMHEDLNIAAAIAAVNSWTGGLESPTVADAALMKQLDEVLGVLALERPAAVQSEIGVFAPGVEPNAAVMAKLEERRAARTSKDFRRSDQIRDELAAMGYAIKDVAGGMVEVRRA